MKYKIICNDLKYLGTHLDAYGNHRGATFECFAYTEDEKVANEFKALRYHRGDGILAFEVHEVTEEDDEAGE